MSAPADSADVVRALRLGWSVAEVRGRNWPGGPRPAADPLPNRHERELPLRTERTDAELRIESQAVLHQLASALGVDTATVKGQQVSRTELIDQQAHALAVAPTAQAWGTLAGSIYELDAHIQDTLAAGTEMPGAAYQLGRGLAEAYWGLDPAAPASTPHCWEILLGEHRIRELTRLAGRLSGYYDPYCAPALAGTLRLWQSVAADQTWRTGAQPALYQQLRRWYGLLALSQDPSTLIRPYQVLRNWHASVRVLRALWPQLAVIGVSLGAVIYLITLVASGSSGTLVRTLLGVLGAAGLSVAAIQAALKNAAQRLLTRLRQDAYTDLVAVAIAVAPPLGNEDAPGRVIEKLVRQRTLTTTWDAPAP